MSDLTDAELIVLGRLLLRYAWDEMQFLWDDNGFLHIDGHIDLTPGERLVLKRVKREAEAWHVAEYERRKRSS